MDSLSNESGRQVGTLFKYPQFDVPLSQQVRISDLGWPQPGEAADESGLGCNREYIDLRHFSWRDAKEALVNEADLIARLEDSEKPEDEYSIIEEECDESGLGLYGLDIGVASTVVALSAGRCIPFSSCNAGAFGGRHHEVYPVVALYAKPETAKLLVVIASEIDIGIENGGNGSLTIFSDHIRKFPAFADAMVRRRREFDALRLSPPRKSTVSAKEGKSDQYELPFK